MVRLACISIDLDPIRCYASIHGLDGALDDRARRLVPEVVLPRFLEILSRASVRGTLFVVAQELYEREEARAAVAAAAHARHEIANHSFAHDYRMSEWGLSAIAEDLSRAREILTEAAGARPVGFRAPGYNVSPHMLAALAEDGYLYDSSVLPSPSYYLARGAVIAAYKAIGRDSGSIWGRFEAALAPPRPYRVRPGRPFTPSDGPLVELPIAVLPLTRMPFIGTLLALPEPVLTVLYRSMRRAEFLNFELHGLDLLDVSDGIPPAVAATQRDARVSARKKAARLAALVERIADDYEVVTLAEAAAGLGA